LTTLSKKNPLEISSGLNIITPSVKVKFHQK
jgi:hypothetical protein